MKGSNNLSSLWKSTGSTRRLLAAVALLGILISFLQFALVRQQVNAFLIQQMEQRVSQAIKRLQRQVNQDQYMIEAIAGLHDADPGISLKVLQQFVNVANHEQSKISYIYMAQVSPDNAIQSTLLLDMTKNKDLAPVAESLPGVKKMAATLRGVVSPKVLIAPSVNKRDAGWVVFVRPFGKSKNNNDAARMVLAFVPVEQLFGDFISLQSAGELSQLIVSEQNGQYATPFFVLSGLSSNMGLLVSHEALDHIQFLDRTWSISFKSASSDKHIIIAGSPYLILAIGLLLTLALVMYLASVRARAAEVARLAESLHKANDELNRRVADEARLARAIRDSEQRYRGIFENASIGICQIAPSGEWVRANRTIAHALGYDSPQELLIAQPDLHGELFVNAEARKTWFDRLNKTAQRDFETQLYTKKRDVIWISLSGHAVRNGPDEIRHFECTMYDVTERRNAERALRQAIKEADFANRSKSEFLANMSHELRTPLNAIIGFSEIIKDQLFGPVGQAQYVEYARDIYDSGELLLSLINDILDMSKIEAGKRTLSESEIDMNETVRSVMRLVSVRAKSGRIRLSVNMPADLPHLRAEEKAIKQILTNLLTNAIKFTPEGGSVTLSSHMDASGRMVIKVEDSGIGMKEEDIPIAMAPFGQIESVLSRKNQGTGLGLPLTKALIELHGGELLLTSKYGEGTTISIYMPSGRVVSKS